MEQMSALDNVKSWMRFFGWENGGSPGSVKRDADGNTVAQHGDATWISDVEICIKRAERDRIVAEIERRERLRSERPPYDAAYEQNHKRR